MSSEIISSLINLGVLGPYLAATIWFVTKIHKEHKDVQEKRVADAKEVATRILELANSQNETMLQLQHVLQKHADMLDDIKEVLRDQQRFGGPRA